MNLLEVGELLKRERERRGVSIRDVMDATKISRRNLTALEEGQVKSLPHPVYLKGYVRNIAKMVGLDADELAHVVDQQYDAELAKYLPQAPAAAPVSSRPAVERPVAPEAPRSEPAPAPQPTPAPKPSPAHEPERETRQRFTPEPLVPPKPSKVGSLRSIAVLVVLVGILVGLIVQYQRMHQDVPPAPVEPPVAVVNATVPDNATAVVDNATAEAPAPEPASADPAPAPAPVPAPEPASAPAAKVAATATPSMPTTSIEVSRRAPVAEASATGMQVLTITAKANEVCWVGVYEGAKGTSFTLRNGESRQVEFAKRASLRLGNAGGVTVRLNGQDYPFEGDRGQKVSLEFGVR